MKAAVRVLVLGALVSGCFLGTPSFTVEASSHPQIVMRVFDQSGLVTGARRASTSSTFLNQDATADPDKSELTVRWMGGVCHLGPAISVSGTAQALHVFVQPDADAGLPQFGDCPAVGIVLGVTLTLSVPVEQDAITLEVR